MAPRTTDLQQVILKKDEMIMQLQTQLSAYERRYGPLPDGWDAPSPTKDRKKPSDPDKTKTKWGKMGRRSSKSSREASKDKEEGSRSLPRQNAFTPAPERPSSGSITSNRETRASSSDKKEEMTSPTNVVYGKTVVLDFTEDSPMFRQQIDAFEESIGGLRTMLKELLGRTKEYVTAGSKYAEEEASFANELTDHKYARALFTTTCPELDSLASLFKHTHDLLKQLEGSRESLFLSMDSSIQHSIGKLSEDDIRDISDFRSRVSKLSDDYEAGLGKLLGKVRTTSGSGGNGLSNTTPQDQQKRGPMSDTFSPSNGSPAHHSSDDITSIATSSSTKALEKEVLQLRRRFEMARFDLVRYLNRVECQKKLKLVEGIDSVLHAYLTHFHVCYDLLKKAEPALNERQQILQKCRQDFELDEKMWEQQRALLDDKLQRDVDTSTSASTLPETFRLPIHIVAHDSRQSHHNASGSVSKQGYLFVRNTMFPARSWKRRWCQIHAGKLYQNRGKHLELTLMCDLMLSRVRETSSSNLPFCFEVIDPNKSKYLLQATSDRDRAEWIDAARRSTESMLEQQSLRKMVHPDQRQVVQELLDANPECADCGNTPAEWVSTNIGCLLCIECSGIHRSLGVQVSKVRSLTLDSWDMSLLVLLKDHLGNKVVNEVWEQTVPKDAVKPTPESSRQEKTKWITDKYHIQGFSTESQSTQSDATSELLQAVEEGSVKQIMWAVAHGVDVNARNDRLETALHIAARHGKNACCEYLLANGADSHAADIRGKFPSNAAKEGGFDDLSLLLRQHGEQQT